MEVPVLTPRTDAPRSFVDPGRVLRSSLLVWGLGHLQLRQGRGWFLALLELAWLIALGASLALLPTDRWLVSYFLLAGFIVVGVLQAVLAYRAARAKSGHATGAAWLLASAPVIITSLTGFWLFAGATATPMSAFERYVSAWRRADTAAAAGLFSRPQDQLALGARWRAEDDLIAARITALTDADPQLHLDRENPESNLRFDYHAPGPGEESEPADGASAALFDVQVVRRVTVPTTFFGLVPAFRTETRVVETVGEARLVRRTVSGPLAITGASLWLIEDVRFLGETR